MQYGLEVGILAQNCEMFPDFTTVITREEWEVERVLLLMEKLGTAITWVARDRWTTLSQ